MSDSTGPDPYGPDGTDVAGAADRAPERVRGRRRRLIEEGPLDHDAFAASEQDDASAWGEARSVGEDEVLPENEAFDSGQEFFDDDVIGEVFDDEDFEDEDPLLGGVGTPVHERRRSSVLLPIIIVLVVLLALGAGGWYGYRWITSNLSVSDTEPQDYEGTGTAEEVVIEVADGDTGSDIAATLVDNGVILSSAPFVQVFTNSPEASRIQPGAYRLHKQMSSQAALDALLDPANVAGQRVTIPEGLTNAQLFARLSEATGIPVADFEAAAADYPALGVPENPAGSAEGYLWPGRYDISEDATAASILTQMAERMQSELEARGVAPEDRHRILTLASIAEKEARTPDDYGRVVRTLDNRLAGVGEANGRPMNLQLDSTVAYATGIDSISTTPEQRATDSPYNTYLHPGLPIGPIANPGGATIDAAISPPEGDWLYWVTVNTETGETRFAATFAEHEQNVAAWRAWAASKDG